MLTSASGIISLLEEKDHAIQVFALQKLIAIIDSYWVEIADAVLKIEQIYDDDAFPHRQLAALLISKIYYHLEAYDEAILYALSAENLFNVEDASEYVDTIIAKCIDEYLSLRVHNYTASNADKKSIDPRLESIVQRMFERCFKDRQYKQAIGIAMEARRLDIFKRAIVESNDVSAMLSYSLENCLKFMHNREFRDQLMRVMVEQYQLLAKPDYVSMCQCLIFLNDPASIARILEDLVVHDEPLALQIAFDIYESATQQFLVSLLKLVTGEESNAATPYSDITLESPALTRTEATTPMDLDDPTRAEGARTESTDPTESGKPTSIPLGTTALSQTETRSDSASAAKTKLKTILSGETTIEQHMQFLIRSNKTDMLLLKHIKDSVRNSVCHNAAVIANGLMHCGTTSDAFLRDNLDWLSRATNWAKFSATASLGVIHKGHEKESMKILAQYLPKQSSTSSGYMEGGGLYALGLIHANHATASAIDYLLEQTKADVVPRQEPVRHGACLGLGLAAMGTARLDVCAALQERLEEEQANVGEAAGLAIGLVMLASGDRDVTAKMLSYASDTQHEKIVRGLAVGISLVVYGRLEAADELIAQLLRDADPNLRRSGIYSIAMAYCGSGHTGALKKLLNAAVSDVNDDVRRAAAQCIGFLLFRTPEQIPQVVSLLTESFNPHVRAGSAIALGIGCAGSGSKDALHLLEILAKDSVSFVRQSALLAIAMIIMQHTSYTCPKLKDYKAIISKMIDDKHEDVMTKFGAIVSQGIVNAGGRNCTISLQSRTGHTHVPSVVGLMVFMQYWYWFPCVHFISLAFTPTCIIAINSDLKLPRLKILSAAKSSCYGYPPAMEEPKTKEHEKVETAVLSITAKAKAREKEKMKKVNKEDSKMDVESSEKGKEETEEVESLREEVVEKMETEDTVETKKKDEPKKDSPEPPTCLLDNQCRVIKPQLKVVSLPSNSEYTTVKPLNIGGILVVKLVGPSTGNEEFVEVVATGSNATDGDDNEPNPPEPFEWTED